MRRRHHAERVGIGEGRSGSAVRRRRMDVERRPARLVSQHGREPVARDRVLFDAGRREDLAGGSGILQTVLQQSVAARGAAQRVGRRVGCAHRRRDHVAASGRGSAHPRLDAVLGAGVEHLEEADGERAAVGGDVDRRLGPHAHGGGVDVGDRLAEVQLHALVGARDEQRRIGVDAREAGRLHEVGDGEARGEQAEDREYRDARHQGAPCSSRLSRHTGLPVRRWR